MVMVMEESGGLQTAVAEEFGEQLRNFQELMFPAAYGEGSREWTHLVLTKVTELPVLLPGSRKPHP